ncbi:MAG: peptidoglycan DD-metalloendopeptidase family protein [Proteobacteria bacterium]|nr:peptidoglycan DD-metalloendopeptidase family protein [Pseudomonadota bacterium]
MRSKFRRFDFSKGKVLLFVTVIAFSLFAIKDIISVEAHIAEPSKSNDIELPRIPLLSFSEEGIIGAEQLKEQVVIVQKGQNLSGIFTDLGLSQGLLLKIANLNADTKVLTKVFPKAKLLFKLSHDGEFRQLNYKYSDVDELIVHQDMGQLTSEVVHHPKQVQLVSSEGVITGSLFGAGKTAGLTDNMVMKLAHIFSWDIDFVLEIRAGDSFNLIYEEVYQNGEYLKDGKILAATFINQGESYEAVYFEKTDSKGFVEGNYYAPDGRSMKKAFLRAPLNFSYISSSFNPRRMHPVQKRIKAHKGIDYSAPKGTPVYAAGSGRVTQASYNKYNGNYVFIKHPSGIVTKYLHFSKKAVKKGQRVKQGQTIGYVGSTGLSTASHLHYEFIYKGVHRNPRTVKLPKSKPLPKDLMVEFSNYAKPLLAQLNKNSQILLVDQ